MSGFVAVHLLGEGVPDGRVRALVREAEAHGLRALGARVDGFGLVATLTRPGPTRSEPWERALPESDAPLDIHLSVTAPGPHARVDLDGLAQADVLALLEVNSIDQARSSAGRLLRDHPGCLLATAPARHGWAVAVRNTGRGRGGLSLHELRLDGGSFTSATARLLLPSCLHGWLTTGRRLQGRERVTLLE
ncbi:hypothetical protein [Streptomyces physcomitrii]|uniref:Uncharacterized protein n=1 Tax=Streptomyces physcomitrii TaxID=2724184 RepID=A0ABX1GYX0_9ACTN|nr:hypothetical protein [Streptomyces physcomitrii]NKI40953.1 hypothetical protein [Streptomyces physcomitrii]